MARTWYSILILLSFAQPVAAAEGFPSKPLRLVVGFSPGGGVDTSARMIASKLPQYLGQQVVVDNRPGAGGSIAAELVARASPDGYTLMMMSGTTLTQTLLYKVRYELLRDFAPVSLVSFSPLLVVVHPSVPAANLTQFLAYAKSNPGKLNFASSGTGGLLHLTGELMQAMSGIRMTHIPYKGMAVAYQDIFAGQVQVGFSNAMSGMQHVRSGRVKALGVTSRNRMKILPDVPTLHEAGMPGFKVTQWSGLLGPARLSPGAVERLNQDIGRVLAQKDLIAHMATDGSEAAHSTPAEFRTHLELELKMWSDLIRRANVRPD